MVLVNKLVELEEKLEGTEKKWKDAIDANVVLVNKLVAIKQHLEKFPQIGIKWMTKQWDTDYERRLIVDEKAKAKWFCELVGLLEEKQK